MKQIPNIYDKNIIDFLKKNKVSKSNSTKSNPSNEKTLQIRSPILNNFLEKTSKSKKFEQQFKFNIKMKGIFLQSNENCTFCGTLRQRLKTFAMISSALQIKHTPNLHYHLTKNINDLITNKRTPKVILYKDLLILNEEQECLKRFYNKIELPERIKNLTEFYQYHMEIPKLHIYSLRRILKRFHTTKRKLEYIFVRKLLGFSVNKDILESSYEHKDKKDDSERKDQNKKKNNYGTSHILKDISLTRETLKNVLGERKSSITFNEFSQLEANFNFDEHNFELNNFSKLLNKITENSFENFKPKLSKNIINAHMKANSLSTNQENAKNLISKTQSGATICNNPKIISNNYKSLEKNIGRNIEKNVSDPKFIIKSNTDRNYDKKTGLKSRKTIDLTSKNEKNSIVSPKSPLFRVNSERDHPSRSLSKELKPNINAINNNSLKKTSGFLRKTNGKSFHKNELNKNNNTNTSNNTKNSRNLIDKKNQGILEKANNSASISNNNHLRYFSLNGIDSISTSRLLNGGSMNLKEKMLSPNKLAIKNFKMNCNMLGAQQKQFVKTHLEEFLTKRNEPLRSSSGKVEKNPKNINIELLQGKFSQNLFKKICQKK